MPIVQILIVAAIFMFFYFGVKGLNGGPIKLSKEMIWWEVRPGSLALFACSLVSGRSVESGTSSAWC